MATEAPTEVAQATPAAPSVGPLKDANQEDCYYFMTEGTHCTKVSLPSSHPIPPPLPSARRARSFLPPPAASRLGDCLLVPSNLLITPSYLRSLGRRV